MVNARPDGPRDPGTGTCGRCGTANPPVAKFCMACGTSVVAADPAPTGLRFVTVTFCDISGSTRLATRLNPEVWHGVLDRYFREMSAAVEAHGGRVEKFIGDAVVGVFGADRPADDDALRAVRASLDALRRLDDGPVDADSHGIRLTVRFGVASGHVVLADRDSSFAIGAVMNRAARLQSAAPAAGPLIDLRTWLLVRDQVRCHPVAPVAAKGFDTALQAWTASSGPHEPAPEAPFVNQRAVLARVVDELRARLREPGCSVIALDGEIGSGKTALLRRLRSAALPMDVRVVQVDCGRDDREQGMWRLLQLDRDLALAAGEDPEADAGRPAASPSTAEVQWRIRRRLASLSAERPVLVLVDNVQWAPDGLLEIVDSTPPHCGPVVFVPAGREVPPLAGDGAVTFSVPALSPDHSRRLLGLLRPASDLELHFTDSEAVVERSGGNPLFLEQLAALASDGIEDLVAPSASAALGARIDRLGLPARRVLGCLGAWGTPVGTRALAATSGLDMGELGAGLAELADRQLAPTETDATGSRRFSCHSAAQVAYAHLPLGERAGIHTAVARHLQRRAGEAPAALDPAVAHAERALECIRELRPGSQEEAAAAALAASCLVAAARRAVGCSEVRRAADLAGRARALGLPDRALTLEIASIESYALAACGQAEAALRLIDEATATVPAAVNPPAFLHLRANELALRPTGAADTAGVRSLAERTGDPHSAARLLLLESLEAIRAGDYPQGESLLLRAHGTARGAGAGLGTAEIHANLGLCLAYGDRPVAEATARCLVLHRDSAGAPALHALVGCSAALLVQAGGDDAGAGRLLDEAQSVFTGIGHRAGVAGLHRFRSSVAEFRGELGSAAEELRHAATGYAHAGAEGAAARCRGAAWVLDQHGSPPGRAAPTADDGWEARLLHHQIEALRSEPSVAREHLRRALGVIGSVRGAGAVLLPLAGCVRIARRTGSRTLLRQAGDALDAAAVARGAMRPKM